jgi:hypothetical protein
MTREDILRMAREAATEDGSISRDDGKNIVLYAVKTTQFLERFAAIVAAAERAACADICDQHASIEGIAQRCAAEIRARNK